MEELNDFFCTVEPEKNELSVTFPFVSIKARFTSSFENLIYVCKKEFYEFAATEYLDRFSMRSFFRLLENHLRELHPSMEKRLEELRKNAVRELEKPKEKQQSERYHRFLPFSR